MNGLELHFVSATALILSVKLKSAFFKKLKRRDAEAFCNPSCEIANGGPA